MDSGRVRDISDMVRHSGNCVALWIAADDRHGCIALLKEMAYDVKAQEARAANDLDRP